MRTTPYTTSYLSNKDKSISLDHTPHFHVFHVLSSLYFADPFKKTLLLCPSDNGTSHAYLSSSEVRPLLIVVPTE